MQALYLALFLLGSFAAVQGTCKHCKPLTWTEVETTGPAPTFIGAHTTVEYAGFLYTFAGFLENFGGLSADDMEKINAVDGEFAKTVTLLKLRGPPSNTFYNQTWTLDTAVDRWRIEDCGTGPSARAFHSAVSDPVSAQMIIYGGITYDGFFADIQIKDDLWAWNYLGRFWEELTPVNDGPGPRAEHNTVFFNGKMYLFGGVINEFFQDSNTLWSYDPVANEWTLLKVEGDPGSPSPRHAFQFIASELEQKIFLYGGEGLAGFGFIELNDTWVYDPATNTWTDITPPAACDILPPKNSYKGTTLVGSKLVSYGGEGPIGIAPNDSCPAPFPQDPTDDTWYFDVRSSFRIWTKVFPVHNPPKLKRHTAEHVGSCVYVIGGWSFECPPGQIWNNDVWVFKADIFAQPECNTQGCQQSTMVTIEDAIDFHG